MYVMPHNPIQTKATQLFPSVFTSILTPEPMPMLLFSSPLHSPKSRSSQEDWHRTLNGGSVMLFALYNGFQV